MAATAAPAPPSAGSSGADTRFFGHPRGLATLFFTEMWERWSFYGMRSLLTLYLAGAAAQGGLGFPEGNAKSLYHVYLALIYLMSVPGGWIADRFLGQRRAVLWGGILIMCGHVVLAPEPEGCRYDPDRDDGDAGI